ncbi:hypothetical protein CIHG_05928 [Coccidioides immitis H538.4]|uniref:Uncharacterized protein n=3 Tax=Coccidioides immitis TaxID=5501 RepID=A0A0J8QVI5_COCIT|nr:hypothetical protein CIRG_01681 [Coccidioides immitis RMSCC 2394]KMU76481.1 hypothetical protein CISG_01215 [Coccidioides immitis RMSCC 3703]KMU87535.1 hypothetical protein CIHG_05928 [Coccidioides immitis H538.4]
MFENALKRGYTASACRGNDGSVFTLPTIMASYRRLRFVGRRQKEVVAESAEGSHGLRGCAKLTSKADPDQTIDFTIDFLATIHDTSSSQILIGNMETTDSFDYKCCVVL